MTTGKKAASAMPRNQRTAKSPPKLVVAAVRSVMEPKDSIMRGSERAGPNFLLSRAKGSAQRTKGMKKIDMTRLYWPSLKPRSRFDGRRHGLAKIPHADP